MSTKPIFVAAHPRACSTAFERVFMTQHDTIHCVHEPFGDAFYYGPERLSSRFENDEHTRVKSGFSGSTYGSVLEGIMRKVSEGKRIFIKDIDYYLFAPDRKSTSIAPSLRRDENGNCNGATTNGSHKEPISNPPSSEPGNPTVMPRKLQEQFHFAFLIRDPHYSVPSYYRCTIAPLREVTNFYYDPLESGYDELRRHFDYLKDTGLVGPHVATRPELSTDVTSESKPVGHDICVVDADDLLDAPEAMIEAFCNSVGLEYTPDMLRWDREIDHEVANGKFEKWRGFHDDALGSDGLHARTHKRVPKPEGEFDADWRAKYGDDAAILIRKTVDQNMADYLYLKQFAMRV